MSANDTTNSTNATEQQPATRPARTNDRKREPKTPQTFKKDASLSQVVQAVASKRKIDATKAGKLVRSHIRGNFDGYARGTNGRPKWSALKDKQNRDGSRYPNMTPSVANYVVQQLTKGRS